MDSQTLKDICVRSCKDMFTQMEIMQLSAESTNNNVSTVINDIADKRIVGDCWEIILTRKIQDVDRIGIRIMGDNDEALMDYGSGDVSFEDYDERSMTIRARMESEELNKYLVNRDKQYIKIISDMKWLINLTEDTFADFGDRIGYPASKPTFTYDDYEFPRYPNGRQPTAQQREAVHAILNSGLSYIWGAPGTGKTQFVLSTAIIAHIKKGHRVAIIAPTNNSLERVLESVITVLSSDDPNHEYIDPDRDILRLGNPTSGFLEHYKNICEDRAISKKIKEKNDYLRRLDQLQLASTAEFINTTLDSIDDKLTLRETYHDRALRNEIDEDIGALIESIRGILEGYDSFRNLLDDVNPGNVDSKMDILRKEMDAVDKSRLSSDYYSKMTEDDIDEERKKTLMERSKLEIRETNNRITTVKIMAMTPYIFMSRRRTLFGEGGIVDVDHIFIDEVGYSNLIQTLPVFMCGRPIAMLGDHMQLPPVCELDREMLTSFIEEPNPDGYMEYGFMWDQSILQIERYLSGDIEGCESAYVADSNPTFNHMARCDLTESHRFSDNLARILDDCVYGNGIRGTTGKDHVAIQCVNVVNNKIRDKRGNPDEADAVKRLVETLNMNPDDPEGFVILTPYRDQKNLLERRCKDVKDNIMTIHSSQGREWHTVIISICDDDSTTKEVALRFTSSVDGYGGLKVMNTAVSRASKRIILVCNYNFWKLRAAKGDLLGKLVASAELIEI